MNLAGMTGSGFLTFLDQARYRKLSFRIMFRIPWIQSLGFMRTLMDFEYGNLILGSLQPMAWLVARSAQFLMLLFFFLHWGELFRDRDVLVMSSAAETGLLQLLL